MAPNDPVLAKWAIFQHSYDEVLAALKHQDDKLNRTLTALAFLTAAGVGLYTRFGAGPLPPVGFAGSGPSVTAVLLVQRRRPRRPPAHCGPGGGVRRRFAPHQLRHAHAVEWHAKPCR
jgi:hypothetical protein